MQNDIGIILIAVTLVQVWIYEVPNFIGRELIPYKPFNCSACLSFWVGVALSILFLNPIFITVYLINQLAEYIRL